MPAPKSPNEMFQVMKANIEEKTGRSLDSWVRSARESGIDTFKALTDHMKTEYGVTHGYAQLIAWGVIDPGPAIRIMNLRVVSVAAKQSKIGLSRSFIIRIARSRTRNCRREMQF